MTDTRSCGRSCLHIFVTPRSWSARTASRLTRPASPGWKMWLMYTSCSTVIWSVLLYAAVMKTTRTLCAGASPSQINVKAGRWPASLFQNWCIRKWAGIPNAGIRCLGTDFVWRGNSVCFWPARAGDLPWGPEAKKWNRPEKCARDKAREYQKGILPIWYCGYFWRTCRRTSERIRSSANGWLCIGGDADG